MGEIKDIATNNNPG